MIICHATDQNNTLLSFLQFKTPALGEEKQYRQVKREFHKYERYHKILDAWYAKFFCRISFFYDPHKMRIIILYVLQEDLVPAKYEHEKEKVVITEVSPKRKAEWDKIQAELEKNTLYKEKLTQQRKTEFVSNVFILTFT